MNLFKTPSELSDYIFRITHNGGATMDCITVIFCDGDYLGVTETGYGFSQWGEGIDVGGWADRVESGDEVDLQFGDLTPELQSHIFARCNEGFRDYFEECTQGEHIARNREAADDNEGLTDSFGQGVYNAADGYFFVKNQTGNEYDLGPYETVREALLATLPTDYSLSGPEYHSTCGAGSLNPCPECQANLTALKAKVQAGFENGEGE